MTEREHNGELEGWLRRYSVAVFAALIAIVYAGVGLIADDWWLTIGGLVIMGAYALIALVGGRTGRFNLLRGDFDERERTFDHRALSFSSTVVGVILFVLFIRDVLNHDIGGLPMYLLSIFGLSYGLAMLYFSLRE